MRFHVLSLPHTQTTHEFDHCAYTAKVRKFCDMMTGLGHEVYLYASEENEAACKEKICIITKEEQLRIFGDHDHKHKFFNLTWGPADECWRLTNKNAIREIKARIQPKDFICVIAGVCQEEVAKAFPGHITVEFGIGYRGIFSKFKVFESGPWMHWVYGRKDVDDGRFYDTVIPNYYDIKEFPFQMEKPDEYYLFVGRLIERKGYRIAQEVCQKMGKKLILAGQGEFDGYGEYIGVINAQRRGELMSGATAVFVPTTYIEPFGGVHAEAMLCGTPVITTDFGVFTETVVNGINGQRCSTFQEFINAVGWARGLTADHREQQIRKPSQSRFGMDMVALDYERYFNRLMDLWADGWYQLRLNGEGERKNRGVAAPL